PQSKHDADARHGGYDRPYGQEEPKLESIPAAVSLVDFRYQLLGVAAVFATEKRDVVLLSFLRRQFDGSWQRGGRAAPLAKSGGDCGPILFDNDGQTFDDSAGRR